MTEAVARPELAHAIVIVAGDGIAGSLRDLCSGYPLWCNIVYNVATQLVQKRVDQCMLWSRDCNRLLDDPEGECRPHPEPIKPSLASVARPEDRFAVHRFLGPNVQYPRLGRRHEASPAGWACDRPFLDVNVEYGKYAIAVGHRVSNCKRFADGAIARDETSHPQASHHQPRHNARDQKRRQQHSEDRKQQVVLPVHRDHSDHQGQPDVHQPW